VGSFRSRFGRKGVPAKDHAFEFGRDTLGHEAGATNDGNRLHAKSEHRASTTMTGPSSEPLTDADRPPVSSGTI
jgi:hypothetical protein